MDLFRHSVREKIEREQPLAARMRPRTLDEFVGQTHIMAPGRLLHRAIQADQLSSLIFYGPPGTGKTTLASVIANTTQSHFDQLNAVLAGTKDIREVTQAAERRLIEKQMRTILFVDEVHRWNKSQQDALLPWVENGTIILIGATTENPYFSVNRALVSRSRIFQLKQLNDEELEQLLHNALENRERGYGMRKVRIDDDALRHIVDVANGDARGVLNALELAVETTPENDAGEVHITLDIAEESIQKRAVLYDKEGDYHFDTISAFIKSLRGSDPDAVLYWLAKMVYAGEDPRFLFRRMLIFAGEDVGLADPQAIVVVEAAAAAFERVGLPEGQYQLAQAALYLATAPKSNSVLGYFDALRAVEKDREGEVPNPLKDGSRDKEGLGHGKGYMYPHAYRDHWVAQQYLPETLRGRLFYQPGRLGYEQEIAEQVERRRELQLAAALDDGDDAFVEKNTHSPDDPAFERWIARTLGATEGRLATLRDRVFEAADVWKRTDRVLCLADPAGLLTWEAVRRTPEGGVWIQAEDAKAAAMVQTQARNCPELRTPQILTGSMTSCLSRLAKKADADGVRFEKIMGRGVLAAESDARRRTIVKGCSTLLAEDGQLVLVEPRLQNGQRLSALADYKGKLSAEFADQWREAEEKVFANPEMVSCMMVDDEFEGMLAECGLRLAGQDAFSITTERVVTQSMLERWWGDEPRPGRYRQSLAKYLDETVLNAVKEAMREGVLNQVCRWSFEYLVFVMRGA